MAPPKKPPTVVIRVPVSAAAVFARHAMAKGCSVGELLDRLAHRLDLGEASRPVSTPVRQATLAREDVAPNFKR